MRFGLTLVSRNRKTGPIPVATSSSDTCPSTCALLTKGCYAKTGPIKLVWDRVDKQGMDFKSFLRRGPETAYARPALALWPSRRPPGQPRRHQSSRPSKRRATGAGLHPPSGLRRHQGRRDERIQYQSKRRH